MTHHISLSGEAWEDVKIASFIAVITVNRPQTSLGDIHMGLSRHLGSSVLIHNKFDLPENQISDETLNFTHYILSTNVYNKLNKIDDLNDAVGDSLNC